VRERFAALANGAVDATLLAPPLDETGEELGMSVVMRITDLAPGYPGLAVAASRAAQRRPRGGGRLPRRHQRGEHVDARGRPR
jgi:ABC-type nitrate/sulfonate/bicarbonate transport system substrate-binding protein